MQSDASSDHGVGVGHIILISNMNITNSHLVHTGKKKACHTLFRDYANTCYTLSILYHYLLHSQYTMPLLVTLSVYYTNTCYTLSILYQYLFYTLSILYHYLLHSQYINYTTTCYTLSTLCQYLLHSIIPCFLGGRLGAFVPPPAIS